MADPLPYYRRLRDEHPAHYIDKWDTYALSRFDDIWQVLGLTDGTFVARRARCRPPLCSTSQRRAGRRSAVAPHAFPRQLRLTDLRERAPLYVGAVPSAVGRHADREDPHLANERLDELLPRGVST